MCRFSDGSCERRTCGAGIMIQVFSKTQVYKSVRERQVHAGGPSWVAWSCYAVERCAPFQLHSETSTVRFGVEHDQLSADGRRRGDVTRQNLSL